jgi:serine/threonine protein kinase
MRDSVEKRLGDFEIVRELGRGGMGVVYEALQVSLNRRVALKVLSAGLGLTSKAVQRFHREAEAAAKLHHTNIVPVYAVGEADGTHYYAMELIDGPSLDHVIRQMRPSGECQSADALTPAGPDGPRSPDLAQTGPYVERAAIAGASGGLSSSSLGSGSDYFDTVARMVAEVADALEYAHQQAIIHRDIKPSNLLLSPPAPSPSPLAGGEGGVRGARLSVNDFGLARMLEQPGMTMTGEFVGTPAYMSPEQITAGRTPLDHRTDIYSLGATLYELLTLQPPFRGERRDQVLAQIMHKDPKAPRTLNPKVPLDLETICLKAMEKDPDRRYQTAAQLADDLRRYVNRFAISARRAGPVARTLKWVKRRPGVAALLGSLLAALLVAGLFAYQAKQSADLLRQKDRQTAVDRAIVEAMSGDAETALRAIAVAEGLGAEAGQLNMLRGLVELHRGRMKEAIVHLEQAERQLPDDVAVRALLATAYLNDGQFQRWDGMIVLADKAEPKTPEDVIFLAQALTAIDPRKGLQILDRAPARLRQSPLVRLTRAMVQTSYAQMTGRVEDAEQALKDVDRVELAENPLLLNVHVQALLTAAHAAGRRDPAAHDVYWKRAGEIAERLARFPDLAPAILGRCYFYYVTGDDDMLLKIVREGKSRVENSASFDLEYDVYYRRKQFDQAVAAIRASRYEKQSQLTVEAIIRATQGKTQEAQRLFEDVFRAMRGGPFLASVLPYLDLLGPGARTDPRHFARDMLNQKSHLVPRSRDGWYHDVLKFDAGQMEVAELEKKAGASLLNLCEAYHYIGLRRLAEGNRAEAKEWFRKSYDTGIFWYGEYMWSRAFLVHIDDPDWLPWCRQKK